MITEGLAQTAADAVKLLEQRDYNVQLQTLVAFDDVFPTVFRRQPGSAFDLGLYPATNAQQDMDDLVLILHSSGSTGLPKPVPMTRKIMLQWATTGMSVLLRYSSER